MSLAGGGADGPWQGRPPSKTVWITSPLRKNAAAPTVYVEPAVVADAATTPAKEEGPCAGGSSSAASTATMDPALSGVWPYVWLLRILGLLPLPIYGRFSRSSGCTFKVFWCLRWTIVVLWALLHLWEVVRECLKENCIWQENVAWIGSKVVYLVGYAVHLRVMAGMGVLRAVLSLVSRGSKTARGPSAVAAMDMARRRRRVYRAAWIQVAYVVLLPLFLLGMLSLADFFLATPEERAGVVDWTIHGADDNVTLTYPRPLVGAAQLGLLFQHTAAFASGQLLMQLVMPLLRRPSSMR